MAFFGKIKETEDEWGFSFTAESFDSAKEVSDEEHSRIIELANSEQKLIKGDKEGNPILVEPPEPSEEEKKTERIKELERYLSSTDWYAIRYADTGETMPEDIKKNRQDARDEISYLRHI